MLSANQFGQGHLFDPGPYQHEGAAPSPVSDGASQREFEDLPMFATAHELVHDYYHSEGTPRIEADWQHVKLREAKQSGLYDDIKTHGVGKPVNVEHYADGKTMLNGHHRMSSAYDINPQMFVPVNHTTDMFENEYNDKADAPGYRKRQLAWRYRTDRPSPVSY